MMTRGAIVAAVAAVALSGCTTEAPVPVPEPSSPAPMPVPDVGETRVEPLAGPASSWRAVNAGELVLPYGVEQVMSPVTRDAGGGTVTAYAWSAGAARPAALAQWVVGENTEVRWDAPVQGPGGSWLLEGRSKGSRAVVRVVGTADAGTLISAVHTMPPARPRG